MLGSLLILSGGVGKWFRPVLGFSFGQAEKMFVCFLVQNKFVSFRKLALFLAYDPDFFGNNFSFEGRLKVPFIFRLWCDHHTPLFLCVCGVCGRQNSRDVA